jgi:tocopherol O-methyltransferase
VITPRRPPDGGAVARHYDELDPFYREVWGEHVHHGLFRTGRETVQEATEALIRLAADHAVVGPGDRVADVGCGYGGTSWWLARNCRATVTGLTLSAAQAREAHTRPSDLPAGVPVPEILVRDWLQNGLASGSFDAVVAIESSTHMPDRQRVFDEMARVLRPGGRLVACVWATSRAPRPWEVRYLLEPICREGRLHGMGSLEENRAWLERAGLTVIVVDDLSRHVQQTWTRVARRVAVGLFRSRVYRRYMLDRRRSERVFVLTVPRLWLAYRTGALRYGFLVAKKPLDSGT